MHGEQQASFTYLRKYHLSTSASALSPAWALACLASAQVHGACRLPAARVPSVAG